MNDSEQPDPVNLGCWPADEGYAFSVWAPHATQVSVVGDFNQWNTAANDCERIDGGCWRATVSTARPGHGYKFFIRNGDETFYRIDPRAREVSNSVGHSIIPPIDFHWNEVSDFRCPNWNEMVIYEMHIGTYHTTQGEVGTFEGAIEKLPYLRDLGVNVVELMPLAEFAGDYSWGYNPAHPYAVETAYGGSDGLKKFVQVANEHGIAVLIDVVYNHFGPSDLDLWRFDGWSENEKGGIYFYNDDRSSTPWGDTRPDYGRSEVRQYILDNALMWLDEFRADGLRYDMTLYIRSRDFDQNNVIVEGYQLLQWVNSEISRRFPEMITIAEDLQNNSIMTKSTDHGGCGFGAQWDAAFVHPVRHAIITMRDEDRSMAAIRDAICHKYNLDVFERVIYTESHDEVANGKMRVVSEIDASESPNRYAIKRSTLGACLMFTSPGIPMLFQGQEFLLDYWFDDARPINWSRAEKYSGIVALYRDLIRLRRNLTGRTNGLSGQHCHVSHVNDLEKVLAMHRWKEGGVNDDTMVVFKFSESPISSYRVGFPYPGNWELLFNSDAGAYHPSMDNTLVLSIQTEAIEYDGFAQSAQFNIGAYSCLIFSRVD